MIKKDIKDIFNIYITGVGGQGIGLLSETLVRAIDYSGKKVKGVDTHGLAQRGGSVESFIRMGEGVHSPLVRLQNAHLVIALERHEALRASFSYLSPNGSLIFYDTSWQPLDVRLGKNKEAKITELEENIRIKSAKLYPVFKSDLNDSRMQNVVLLANIFKNRLLPNVKKEHYVLALRDLLSEKVLEQNVSLFEEIAK